MVQGRIRSFHRCLLKDDLFRDFVGNYLPRFRINNPQIEIIVQEQKGHPCFIATYRSASFLLGS